MLFETIGQDRVFLWMALFGAAGGGLYLLLAGLRGALHAGKALAAAVDLAFGLGLGALFALGLYTANYGAFRLYCLAGFCAGYALVMLGVAAPVSRAAKSCARGLDRLFKRLSNSRLTKVIFR